LGTPEPSSSPQENPSSTAASTEAVPQRQVQVEEKGPCERLVKIEIPQEKVHEEIEKSYEELRKTVFIKGFRPGHIPRHVLEKRFGEQVLDGVKHTLVDENFEKAVEEKSLKLALPAKVDYAKVAIAADKPLAFEVAIEIVPAFAIESYKGLAVERPAVVVTKEDVDKAVEGLRLRHGRFHKLEGGEIADTDVAVCHGIALQNGEEIWRENELGANVTGETLGTMLVPGLKAAFLGAKAGETKTFKLTLPQDFVAEEHRGKEVDLEVTIDEIRRFDAPQATDEWAKSLKFEDLGDLRDELQDELRRHGGEEADDVVHARVAEQLLHLASFEVPQGLVEHVVERTKDRHRAALLYRGVPKEEIDKAVEELTAKTREESAQQCKLYFIYEKIAEMEKLFITEDEVRLRIQAIALNYRRRPEEVASELERTGRLSSMRQQMREEKVRDFLVQNARVQQAGAAAPPPAQPPSGEGEAKAAES